MYGRPVLPMYHTGQPVRLKCVRLKDTIEHQMKQNRDLRDRFTDAHKN